MAEQEIGVTGGAEVTCEDAFRLHTGSKQLRAVRFSKIEADVFRRRLMARRHHIEPLERVGFIAGTRLVEIVVGIGELRREFTDKVGGDFVAAGADGWAYGSEEIPRLAAELILKASDGFLRNASERAAPTSMNRGDDMLLWINEENGNAIGSLHAEQKTRDVRKGGVAFRRIGGRL